MSRAVILMTAVLGSTLAFAQRPSNPALLIPESAPELDYVPVADPVSTPTGNSFEPWDRVFSRELMASGSMVKTTSG